MGPRRTPLEKAVGDGEQPKSKKPKGKTMRHKAAKPKRNAPCPCGSKTKYKNCCGKPVSQHVTVNPYQSIASQYTPEQQAASLEFVERWGFTPNPTQLMMFMEAETNELSDSILRGLREIDAPDNYVYAVKKLGRLITPKNQRMQSPKTIESWNAAMAEYEACQQPTSE